MLKNNRIKFALSLIIAVIIWGYVMIDTNPIETRTLKDIPITYINEDNLEDDGLALLFKGSEIISVTVEGNRSDVNAIDKNDIVATVDLSDAVEGENNLRVTVHVPDRVDLVSCSPSKVTLTTEKIDTKEVSITPLYLGKYDDDEEPVTVEMSHTKVNVTGAKSLIETVDHVNAQVPEGAVTQELKTIRCELEAVDVKGEPVKHVDFEISSVNVMTEIAKTKTVNLEIPIVDNSGFTKKTSGPKTIVIKGISSDIDKINNIQCKTIDLSDVKENTVIDVTPILPEGISVSEKSSDVLLLAVTIPERVTKEFSFTGKDIRVSNLDKGKKAVVEDGKYTVAISGSDDVVGQIKKEDIFLFVDLKNFETGQAKASINAACEKNFEEIHVTPGKAKVTIEDKEQTAKDEEKQQEVKNDEKTDNSDSSSENDSQTDRDDNQNPDDSKKSDDESE